MFKALSSKTRREMIKILSKEEMHVTGLAEELGISVPVASKHLKVLLEAGLVRRRILGKSHIYRANMEKVYSALDGLGETVEVEVPKGASVLDALRKVAGIRLGRVGEREFVTDVDGDKGYYVYEVDGELPEVGMERFTLEEDTVVELKKILYVRKKRMRVKVRVKG